ncbi:hypothetical protein KUV62_11515 [Salipiger bermudensis]|uniref:hypothetical protein n=1 Tax=Salipiger bermudensis TaxID=344736 RepID=UPI001C9A1A48|nr:hypothetical protein [Salipiger bermudensis]MBY6004542.1 hypothetical protein [Salipiger bermudensis]
MSWVHCQSRHDQTSAGAGQGRRPPRIVGGNTNAPSILIGALGAEKIAAGL